MEVPMDARTYPESAQMIVIAVQEAVESKK